jgi:hypothetical protein
VSAFDGRKRPEPAAESGTPLDGLLSEMRELRLTLAADLNAAAGAAEEGAEDIAAQIVDADRRELALFARDADRRLRRLARSTQPQAAPVAAPASPRWRRRLAIALPVVPMVGALAVSAAAATGVLQLPSSGSDRGGALSSSSLSANFDDPASSTFRNFADVVGGDPSAAQVIAAADRLHSQLAKLLASSSTDPDSAAQLVQLLRMEQSLLLTEQPPGADVVLHATRKLAKQLVDVVNAMTEPTSPHVIPTFTYDSDNDNDGSTKKTSPSPSPTKTSSSPKPTRSTTTSPAPSPSSTYTPPLPAWPQVDED